MNPRQKRALRWALYGALLFVTLLAQTVVLQHIRPFGLVPSLMPVALVCVAMRESAEHAALCGLLTGLVWCLAGGDCGSLAIVTMTASAALAALVCQAWLNRNLFSGVLLCLGGLLVVEGGVFLVRLYLGSVVPTAAWTVFLPALGLSILTSPIYYGLVAAIAKVGR